MKNSGPLLTRRTVLAAASALALPGARAAAFPRRPIRFVVPFSAGGTTDVMARALQVPLEARLKQPIVVDNRGGAYGAIGSVEVMRAAPDGHTLLFGNNGLLTVTPTLQPSSHYTHRSFTPVSLVATTPFILAVHPRVTARNLQEFLSYARAQPGGVNFASAGGIIDLTTDLLAKEGKIDIVKIPYKGTADAMNALAAGDVHAMITTPAPALSGFFQAGRARMLGILSNEPSPLYPEAQLIARELPALDVEIWFGFLAPNGTPAPVVAQLGAALAESMALPEVRQRFIDAGATPKVEGPESISRRLDTEVARWAPFISSLKKQ